MNPQAEFCPVFDRPPVVETLISVQFKPLVGFRAAHFGLFWLECLGGRDWTLHDDAQMIAHEMERFDSPILNLPPPESGTIDSLGNRAVFRSPDGRKNVHLQPDRLLFSCVRNGDPRPSYSDLRNEFDPLFDKFQGFCQTKGFGAVEPDLWEVSYTNALPKGDLWETPHDWHRIFPGLFHANVPSVAGLRWTTYDGEWYFEMSDQAGRVRAKARKAVVNQTGSVVLLLTIRARGPVPDAGLSWSEGMNLGHDAAIRLFHGISSEEARKAWGERA